MNKNDIFNIEHEVRKAARAAQRDQRHVYELNGHSIQLDVRSSNSVNNGADYIGRYKIDGKRATRAKVLELVA